ncbi:hypothetical protein OA491_03025 [Alphaproteobacteria bacterium]|nr:hypothetical protein [Alphaproteobacteria bacterium]
MKKLKFSIGILSWKGYDSLYNSLKSYEEFGLNSLTKSKFLCLPEYNCRGIEISKKFGYKPILFKNNIGILNGFKSLALKMPDGPVLLLENDLPLVENSRITFTLIKQSLEHLYKYDAAQVRLRSIKDPGEPFHSINKYNNYWGSGILKKLKRYLRPNKAKKLIGTGIYVEEEPHLKFSKFISRLENNSYLITSDIMNWSNLAIMVDKNFFLNVIIKEAEMTDSSKKINGFKNIEIELNKRWWRDKRWNLIITNGLFKHLRVDNRGY